MYRAQPVDEAQAPRLHPSSAAGHARADPDAAHLHDPQRHAQRLRDRPEPQHAAVAVTEGITRILDEDELEGVLAHELSHVRTATC